MATNTMNPQPSQTYSSSPQTPGAGNTNSNRSMRERAGLMFNDGRERAKASPYAAAAIAGGVVATAAAAIYGGAKLAQSYSEDRKHPRRADGRFKKS